MMARGHEQVVFYLLRNPYVPEELAAEMASSEVQKAVVRHRRGRPHAVTCPPFMDTSATSTSETRANWLEWLVEACLPRSVSRA